MFSLKQSKKDERKISYFADTFKADEKYIYYSNFAKSIRVLKEDIESVSIDTDSKSGIGHIGYNYLKINGKGTLLAEIHLTSGFAKKAQDFILEETKNNKNTITSNLDDLEKLSSLKEKGIITQEEFNIKKKQILGL